MMNEISENDESDSSVIPGWLTSVRIFLFSVIATTGLYFFRDGNFWIEVAFILSAATSISVLISEACDPFADAAQWVGIQLRWPSSVRGATLDAIASSMPELFTGLFFVSVALTSSQDSAQQALDSAEGYGSTIATCAGSSIYNLILIPAVCAIAVSYCRREKPYIEISKEVVNRDGMWVIVTQFGLLAFLFQPKLHWWMGLVALLAYAVYVGHLYLATRKYRVQLNQGQITTAEAGGTASLFFGRFEIGLTSFTATMIIIVATLVAALACYLLVELTNESAKTLGVAPFFVAVILTAAVSSIPDTFMSLGSATRGDDSGAVSNVFGSNIFDICIGMSIPLIVSCYLNDWQPVQLTEENGETFRGVFGLRIFLFGLTVTAMLMMWKMGRITRKTGWFFCFLYAIFFGYAIFGALGFDV
ncbi:MAG: hypothetical protein AAF623_01430 [Planctomycetota bacterium]